MMYQKKREAAIQWLGERWVLHRSRRVQRLSKAEQQDIHKADVAATFEKARQAMQREAQQ